MLNTKIQDAINDQIGYEFYSAYLYLAMSAHFATLNLGGFAAWMRTKFSEEQVHALKFFDYINDRGGQVRSRSTVGKPTSSSSRNHSRMSKA